MNSALVDVDKQSVPAYSESGTMTRGYHGTMPSTSTKIRNWLNPHSHSGSRIFCHLLTECWTEKDIHMVCWPQPTGSNTVIFESDTWPFEGPVPSMFNCSLYTIIKKVKSRDVWPVPRWWLSLRTNIYMLSVLFSNTLKIKQTSDNNTHIKPKEKH